MGKNGDLRLGPHRPTPWRWPYSNWRTDRALALDTIATLGTHITSRSKSGVARALADLMWLNHRIDQVDGMATPLWCHVCADPPEYPGSTWMIWECLEHAEPQLARSAKNWEQSLCGNVL